VVANVGACHEHLAKQVWLAHRRIIIQDESLSQLITDYYEDYSCLYSSVQARTALEADMPISPHMHMHRSVSILTGMWAGQLSNQATIHGGDRFVSSLTCTDQF
jgi:hypothetical protein